MSITLGKIYLKHGLFLAPMAGVTDRAFRRICRFCGAEYTVTEMVSSKALHFHDAESLRLAEVTEEELPCAVQLFGHEPEIMAEATALLFDGYPHGKAFPSSVDINMGCPVKKIVSGGDGSALMRNPALAGAIVRAVSAVSPVPVTVKIRAGWSDKEKNAVEVALAVEENGGALITVHGRTREQMYSPPVDTAVIAAVKTAVSIPVVANGGITTAAEALSLLEKTGCDGLMIARGAMGNPWLFSEISAALEGQTFALPPLDVRIKTALAQAEAMIADKGERVGTLEARRQLSYYIRGNSGAAETRHRLNLASSLDEMAGILADYLSHATERDS